MSFLDSVLSSIETGKPATIPTSSPAPSPTVSTSNSRPESRRPLPAARPVPAQRPNGAPAGTKRKAEEPLPRTQKAGLQKTAPNKPATTNLPSRLNNTNRVTKPSTGSNAPAARKTPPVPSKPPVKGSFADIMAKAKAAQQTAPTQVGMFKHQAAPKEKLSKMERKKRMMEAQAKEKDAKQGKKAGISSSSPAAAKVGGAKPINKRETEEPSYKGTARPSPAEPAYRGTANLPSRNGDRKGQFRSNKRSKMDEYLGTDEEDEGEYGDEQDDYYSESSDMEAGLDDVEGEEAAALAAARREDEEDIRAEAAAKQAKLDRRNKLSQLASRR